MLSASSSSVAETMSRLSSKSGVLACLSIERTSGSLIAFKGSSNFLAAASAVPAAVPITYGDSSTTLKKSATASVLSPVESAESSTGSATEDQKVNDFVQMIWKYISSSEQMIRGMDQEEDLKLLRLRTKKHELVIVPDSKFIFVVVHDVKSS